MIHIENLSFRYGRKPVYEGLTLDLSAGHIYGLLGRNGTGKSTLLRLLCGLLHPEKGMLRVNGHQPGKRQPSFLQQVFLVPETFALPHVSVTGYVKNNAGFYPGFDAGAFAGYLDAFEIPVQLKLRQMSYGQQKKLLIAFGLACNTRLLLLDEPTNGLDIVSKSQFRKLMAGLVTEEQCVLISTHQVKDLENLIDHVLVVDEGQLLFDAPVYRIQQALHFSISYDEATARKALYAENVLQGNAIITANNGNAEGLVDLELLYKAIVMNPAGITAAFSTIPTPLIA